MLFVIVYGVLSVLTWSAFAIRVKDLARDWRNRDLQLLCLGIGGFALPFCFAMPPVYIRVDALLGRPNIATLIVYTSVAIGQTACIALLVTWSAVHTAQTARPQYRLWQRLIVGYAVATTAVMPVLFFLGSAVDEEHPVGDRLLD